MRCTFASRILTFFTLAVLTSSHSFLLVNAQLPSPNDNDVVSPTITPPAPPATSTPTTSPSAPPSSPPASSPPVTSAPPPDSPTNTKITSTPPSTSSPPTSQAPSPSSPPPSKPISPTSSPSPSPSSDASQQSSSSSSSGQSSSSSSSSSSVPTSSQRSSTSSSGTTASVAGAAAQNTLTAADTGILTVPTQTGGGVDTFPSAYNYLSTSGSDGASPTGEVTAASSKGFFQNTGAVAGTFTAVGLVVAGIAIAILVARMKRRNHKRDEEDAAYFEKYGDGEQETHDGLSGPNYNTFGNVHNPSMAELTTPAAPDAYPDRALHYGNDAAAYGEPESYGMEYPPNTAYAAAAASGGTYQYGGDHYGGEQYGGAQYAYTGTSVSPERVSPGPHPFADPSNVARPGGAPPVNDMYHSEAYVLGEAQ